MQIVRKTVTFEHREQQVTVEHGLGEEFVLVQLYHREINGWHGEMGVMVNVVDENTITLRLDNRSYGITRAVRIITEPLRADSRRR